MLDDLKYIHNLDKNDALGVAEKSWQQLEHEFTIQNSEQLDGRKFENIVFSGMGGSALAGTISKTWPSYTIPFEVCREYLPPHYTSKKTLFIASSYSGNTEETVESLLHAVSMGAFVVVITSGGQLEEIAKKEGFPCIMLPSGLQPRYAVFYDLKAQVKLLESVGLVSETSAEEQLHKAAGFLSEQVKWWRPDVPKVDNYPKQIAYELMGKSPVVYAGPLMYPAAYKWKISFNENAKNVAWCNQVSEFHHNEFLGWSSHPVEKPYAVINLRSNFEHPRIDERFEITEKLLSGKWPHPINIQAQGQTLLEQILWHISFGDHVSIYLGLLNGLNPTPVDLIEKFKKELSGH